MKICSECQRCYDDVVEECAEWHGQLAVARPGSVSMIAGYRIEQRLYAGLRGDLFRATRMDCGRACVIRMIAADEEAAKLFLAEAKIVADLYHPNLTAIYESGTTEGGECFAVSEDATDCETLRDLLDRSEQLELLESIRIVRVIAETLDEIHKAGVVFRAVNPDNILVSNVAAGEVNIRLQNPDLGGTAQDAIMSNRFLIDTETASIKYFSPEQCGDEAVTARSDVYSLGVLLYELIAGVPPFDADRAAGVIEQHRHARPSEIKIDNFDLRMLISHTLMESLGKRPEARQSSADLFARQLRHIEQLATHVSTPAPVVKVTSSAMKAAPRLITLAESGLHLTESADTAREVLSSPPMVSKPPIVGTRPNDQPAIPARRRVTIQPETVVASSSTGTIDAENIKPIDFRAARERMKDLLEMTPTTPAEPKLIRLDEPLDDVPSIDDTLEVLRSEGNPAAEFHDADYRNEIRESPGNVHLIVSEECEPVVLPVAAAGLTGLKLYAAAPMSVKGDVTSPPASDDEIFASIESFSAVRFARLRRGMAIGAAAGLIALAFTFRADIVDVFTPFDLGKLEPPPYRPSATSVAVPTHQTSETIAAPVTQYEITESVPVVAEDLPMAVRVSGTVNREDRSVARKAAAVKAPGDRAAEPVKNKPQPEQYKPETLVITYPDPKTRKASNDRDPFAKPRSGTGMTRPRVVANPKP